VFNPIRDDWMNSGVEKLDCSLGICFADESCDSIEKKLKPLSFVSGNKTFEI
jgi:hypothetical protein